MFTFSILVSPSIGRLAGNLSRFAGDIRSAKEALEQARDEVVIPRVASNISGQTAAGLDWPDMHPDTPFFPYRRRHDPGGSAPLLNVTGKLLSAATAQARWEFDGQQGTMFVPSGAFQGSSAPYGEIQHEGGFTPGLGGHTIPPRPFFEININEDLPPMEQIFSEWFGERFNAALDAGRGSTLYGERN